MKTLNLLRHAKSSWDDPSLSDHQRPLNQRGIQSCQLMAEPILDCDCDFTHTFCSTARRAELTISGIYRELGNLQGEQPFEYQLDHRLYTFDEEDLMQWCKELDDEISEVVIVGHNPAITLLCERLCENAPANVPTCGYLQLELDIREWRQIDDQCAELVHFLKPKMFL